ncbi:MAG: ABC transporter permease [Acidimicrobiales bacterium]
MLRLALRSARTHWRRFTLTTVAVVVGVSFVTGSFVLTDSLAASIDHLLADATGRTDFVVRGVDGSGTGGGGRGVGAGLGGPRGGLPATVVAALRAVPGVSQVDPSVVGAAQLLGKGGNAKAFDVGVLSNWPDHPEMGGVRLLSGRPPSADADVVIDGATAATRGLHLGDGVRIGTRRGIVRATVVGLAERGGGGLGAAGTVLAFTLPRATELVGTADRIDNVAIRLAAGTNRERVRQALTTAAGPGAAVLSSDTLLADARQRIQDRLANFNSLMLGFAAVTLFVSAFLIWNTFSIVVAQRRRELALLRAVGASTGQVFGSIVTEGAVVGAVSSGAGIGVGVLIAIGLRRLLSGLGVDLPASDLVLAPRTVLVAVLVGLGVTLVSVMGPARRTTRIPPVAALQSAALPAGRGGRGAPVVGVVLLVLGALVGATGLFGTSLEVVTRMSRIGIGALLLFIGVTAIARFLASPVIGAIGAPFRRLGGVPAALARRNAVRDPRRTAATASALMIGLALVSTTLVLGDSVKTAFGGALRSSIRSDIVVDAGGIVPFDAATLAAISKVPGVTGAVPITFARTDVAPPPGATVPTTTTGGDRNRNDRIGITVGTPDALAAAVDPQFTSGTWPADDRHVAVAGAFATDHRLRLGSTVTLRAVGVDRRLTVSGIYARDELLDDAVTRPGAVAGLEGIEPVTRQVMVTATSSSRSVLTALRRATALVPNSTALTADDYVTDQTSALDIVLGIVDVLLFFAVAVAALGIANTLALSVVERTRELGLLRAVGMERRQLRRMVRVEGVLVALLGGVLGVGLGVAFGSATAAALPPDTAVLTFPAARLVLVLLAAGVLGLVAAAVPARRAARLNVLAAVAED